MLSITPTHHSLNDAVTQLEFCDTVNSVANYACLLRQCGNARALDLGKRVHLHIVKHGFGRDKFIANLLMEMYGKCGSANLARELFDNMFVKTSISWNMLIGAYARNGQIGLVFEAFFEMRQSGIVPDKFTFITMLSPCLDLVAGKLIHGLIIRNEYHGDVFVGTALVNLYAKCKNLADMRGLFQGLKQRDVVLWNSVISAYARSDCGEEALELLEKMQFEGMIPDYVTFISLLEACASIVSLSHGKRIHAYILSHEFEANIKVGTALLNMYGKCGCLEEAWGVFARISHHNLVSWNAMIGACAQNLHSKEAVCLFGKMQQEGFLPDNVTCLNILNACAILSTLTHGKKVHASILGNDLSLHLTVGNALANMYGKHSDLKSMWIVFSSSPKRDVVSWNAFLATCVQQGFRSKALQFLQLMQLEGLRPNMITFLSILDGSFSLPEVKHRHALIMKAAVPEADVLVWTSLINLYGKCGSLNDALTVYEKMPVKSLVTWNSMIFVCVQNGHHCEGLRILSNMEMAGVVIDKFTLSTILNGFSNSIFLAKGLYMHALILIRGLETDIVVSNALIDMYGNCGDVEAARLVFDNMLERDIVSWNTMIATYAQNGHAGLSLHVCNKMQWDDLAIDRITCINVLNACSNVAALRQGKHMHMNILRRGIEEDLIINNSLLSMYSKCGSIQDAEKLFDNIQNPDQITWVIMIGAYAQSGHGKKSLLLFQQMQREGIMACKVTFVNVLSACGHAGLLDAGFHYFLSMAKDHGLTIDDEHSECIVDLLARASKLDETHDFILTMPFQCIGTSWSKLLSASRTHFDTG